MAALATFNSCLQMFKYIVYLDLDLLRVNTTILGHTRKAIKNKLYILSQDFFQKEEASEAKKNTHNEKTHKHF